MPEFLLLIIPPNKDDGMDSIESYSPRYLPSAVKTWNGGSNSVSCDDLSLATVLFASHSVREN